MNIAYSTPSLTQSSNEILADNISKLAAHIHAATYRFLVMVREFDQREAWADMGARSCAHWLNWRCGINVHTAREKLRVAHALVDLDKISAAFERGELSYSKIRAVTRIANRDNESILLNIALSGTAAQLERLVRCELRTEREDQIETRTQTAFEQREFGWRTDEDGSVVFFGRLPAELAEHVIGAINATSGHVPEETSPTAKTRRADALVAMADQGCQGYEVMLHVPAGTSFWTNSSENSGTIPAQAAKRLCCGAAIVPVTEDEQGNVLDIGRRTRKIPGAIRRALDIRDKSTCRFPGCTHTNFLQGHHIKHWAQCGKTCLDNLVLLCWHHHHLMHEGGFSCRFVKGRQKNDAGIVFTRPDGVAIPNAFRLLPVEQSLEQHQSTLTVDEYTCTARDGHSQFDVGVVIDALDVIKRRKKRN